MPAPPRVPYAVRPPPRPRHRARQGGDRPRRRRARRGRRRLLAAPGPDGGQRRLHPRGRALPGLRRAHPRGQGRQGRHRDARGRPRPRDLQLRRQVPRAGLGARPPSSPRRSSATATSSCSPSTSPGPALAAGTRIPLERTAVPVELDRISQSLDDLMVALGPDGANKNGALNEPAATPSAANLDGNGDKINGTVHDLSTALSTLSGSRDDLFGTVKNLQSFTSMLATNNAQVRRLNSDLATRRDPAQRGAREPQGDAREPRCRRRRGLGLRRRQPGRCSRATSTGRSRVTSAVAKSRQALAADPRERARRPVEPPERLPPRDRHARHPQQRQGSRRPVAARVLDPDRADADREHQAVRLAQEARSCRSCPPSPRCRAALRCKAPRSRAAWSTCAVPTPPSADCSEAPDDVCRPRGPRPPCPPRRPAW